MASGTGNLPNQNMDFTPFDILTAEEMDDLVENIESLADGTGIGDGSVTTNTLAPGAVDRQKIDWADLLNNIKSASNGSEITPTNSNQNFSGIAVTFDMASAGVALVTVSLGVTSASDFEFRPQIRLNGSTVLTMNTAATLSAASRAVVRTFSGVISLSPGSNVISAGASISAGSSLSIPANSGYVSAVVFGEVNP